MEQNRGYVRGRVSGEKLRDSSSNYSSRMSSNSLHNFGAHKGSHEHHHFKEWKHTETGGYHFKNSNFIQAQHSKYFLSGGIDFKCNSKFLSLGGKRRHDQLSQQELRKPYSDVGSSIKIQNRPYSVAKLISRSQKSTAIMENLSMKKDLGKTSNQIPAPI